MNSDKSMEKNVNPKKKDKQKIINKVRTKKVREKVRTSRELFSDPEYFIDPDKLFVESFDKISDNIKSKKIISIEIGPSGFRVLYLSTLYHRYRIIRFGEEPFVSSKPTAIKNDIKSIPRILKRRSIRHSEIVLCLTGPEIFIKTVTVPELSGNELKEAIYWTINKDTVIFSETDIWDYEIVGKTTLNNKPAMEVLTICAHDDYVRKYLDLLKNVGIQPDRIIVKPVALVSALKLFLRDNIYYKNNFILVDLDKDKMTVCFLSYGNLKFVRTLNINYEENKKNNSNQEKAEDDNNSTLTNNLNIDHVGQLKILHEIKRSITFFNQNSNIQNINCIFLTGIGCDSDNFDEFLSKHLSIKVKKPVPIYSNTKNTQKIKESSFTSVIGAACSEFNLYKLIPKDVKLTKKYKFYQKILVLISFMILIFISGISIKFKNNLEKQKFEHSEVYNSYMNIQDIDIEYTRLINEVRELNTSINLLEETLKLDRTVEENLKILSNYTPDDISLDQLEYLHVGTSTSYYIKNYTKGDMKIKGKVYKNFVFADVTIEEFIKKLQDLYYYKSVTLNKKRRDIVGKKLFFDITLELKE